MELKRRVRQAIELAVFVSALPLLLLGCGGGGTTNTDPNAGRVFGQFWTDITSADGLRGFTAGLPHSTSFPTRGEIITASFSGGTYHWGGASMQLVGGVWATYTNPYLLCQSTPCYYLSPSGWSSYSNNDSLAVKAVDANHFNYQFAWVAVSAAISTINLAGTPIVASSAVPAIDSNGVASQVSPSSAVYPAGAYQFDITSTTETPETYILPEDAVVLVTTISGSAAPIDQAHFNAATFSAHTSTSDPICTGSGYAFVYSGVGATYNVHFLTLNSGLATSTPPTCQNSSIISTYSTPYELSFSTINGETIATFVNSTGGKLVMGLSPANGKPYLGIFVPAEITSGVDSLLNKTAMDAALTAWGVPTF